MATAGVAEKPAMKSKRKNSRGQMAGSKVTSGSSVPDKEVTSFKQEVKGQESRRPTSGNSKELCRTSAGREKVDKTESQSKKSSKSLSKQQQQQQQQQKQRLQQQKDTQGESKSQKDEQELQQQTFKEHAQNEENQQREKDQTESRQQERKDNQDKQDNQEREDRQESRDTPDQHLVSRVKDQATSPMPAEFLESKVSSLMAETSREIPSEVTASSAEMKSSTQAGKEMPGSGTEAKGPKQSGQNIGVLATDAKSSTQTRKDTTEMVSEAKSLAQTEQETAGQVTVARKKSLPYHQTTRAKTSTEVDAILARKISSTNLACASERPFVPKRIIHPPHKATTAAAPNDVLAPDESGVSQSGHEGEGESETSWRDVGEADILRRSKCRRIYAKQSQEKDVALFYKGGTFYALEAWCSHM
ncbi:hypothetical protein EGW08_008266, partial [Elysia chlorotica]